MTATVDLFSGIGWGFACRDLGIDEYGIDIEPTVFKTREAFGMDGLCADITELDPSDWAGVEGLIASPPCQSWSRAGKGLGLDDPRGQLVWQPLAWALAIRPRWVACEQVPEARGAFDQIAYRLREVGYHTDVYTLSSETFGVPQTRLRVFLVAHRDFAPQRPKQTHQRYRKGRPRVEPCDMLGLLPWVSMAEAIGVDSLIVDTGTNSEQAGGGVLIGGNQTNACVRSVDEPAPTIPAHIGKNQQGESWAFSRPSTTVCADPRVSLPVHHDGSQSAGAVPYTDAGADKPVALTESQGCRLMGFPDGTDQHLAGNKQDRWRLIGNAVCPPVGRAVLATLTAAPATDHDTTPAHHN